MDGSVPVLLSEAVAAYLEAIARVRTENVVANHISVSKRFLAFFSGRRYLNDLRRQDLLAFLDWFTHRRGASYTANTFNLGLEFARRLGAFARAQGWLEESPAEEIPFVVIEVVPPVTLTGAEMDRLIEAARGDDLNRLLVGLLGEMGLKKQELVALQFADLELESPAPLVVIRYSGKLQKKSRRLPLLGELAAALRRYRERRQARGTYSFLGPLVPITGRQVNNILVSLCKQAGIRRANPQILRDTAAVQLLLAGRLPEEVAHQLGYTPRGYLLEFVPRFSRWMEPPS